MPSSSVTCVGEPLALVAPGDLHADAPALSVGGAEANVAAGLAAYGTPVAYVSRVGDDAEGRTIRTYLETRGVDVRTLETGAGEFTGRYAKAEGTDEHGQPQTSSVYRRRGSAASSMGPHTLEHPAIADALQAAGIVHLSGITPALSESCAAMVEALVIDRRPVPGRLTFDVNWRAQLWPDGDSSRVARLADHADVVLVGADEAEAVLGTADPHEIRRRLPRPEVVVVKDGAVRAIALARDGGTAEVPSLRVDVVEPVGAGDSFAAGFLVGMAAGEPPERCLRRGHIGAAATLTVRADFARPHADATAALLTATEQTWRASRVGPAGMRVAGSMYPSEEVSS